MRSRTRTDQRLGWRVAFTTLMTAGMVLAIFSAPIVSVLASFLIEDLGMDRTQLGWVLSIYAGVGAIGSPLAGRVSDSLGGRVVLALAFGAAGLGVLGIALAPSPTWLTGMALVSGIAWATANPSTNKLVASHIRRGRQGVIMGVKQSGVQIGFFLGGALLPLGALTIGWRPTVGLVAAACGLGFVVTLLFLPAEPRIRVHESREEAPYRRSASGRWLASYSFLMGAAMASVSTYLPLFAQESVGVSPGIAGAVASVAGLTGVVSRILWSRRSEHADHHGAPLAAMSLASVVAVLAVSSATGLGAWVLWPGAVAAGAGLFAWNAVVMLAAVTGSEARHAGRASGVVHLGFLSGLALGPVSFGFLVDSTGTYAWSWTGVGVLCLLGALLARAWVAADND